jgi:hypothetical protein
MTNETQYPPPSSEGQWHGPPPSPPQQHRSWIRRHKVISSIAGAFLAFLALCFISGFASGFQSHRTKTQPQYNISYTNPSPQYTTPQYTPPSAPTPAQRWSGDPEGGAYQNAPNQPINSGGFDYNGNS